MGLNKAGGGGGGGGGALHLHVANKVYILYSIDVLGCSDQSAQFLFSAFPALLSFSTVRSPFEKCSAGYVSGGDI